jgi:hypothetical protein
MRIDRTPNAVQSPRSRHSLAYARPGVNRHRPGKYVCWCGQEYTGLNGYESHRAREREATMNALLGKS